ncbi:MAG TPA: hypothetical protein VFC10_15980 [Terriglobia bacterium]|nr:hypothetical protein [Terriglobia bacterium]
MISVAQEDHPYLLEWLGQAQRYGGGFLSSFAHAAMVADNENYPLACTRNISGTNHRKPCSANLPLP